MSRETDDMAMWYQQLADTRKAGAAEERERIIEILRNELNQQKMVWDDALGHPVYVNRADLIIALIKGEN